MTGQKWRQFGSNRLRFRLEVLGAMFVALGVGMGAAWGVQEKSTSTTGNRFLFIVENSSAMSRRDLGLRQSIFELVNTGLRGHMQSGDTFGVWTFNTTVDTRFPMQTWEANARLDLGTRVNTFIRNQGYHKRSHLNEVMLDLANVAASVGDLTVVLLNDGNDKMSGTPFDREINDLYRQIAPDAAKDKLPVLTGLTIRGGTYVAYSVVSGGDPLELPPPPERPRPAKVPSKPSKSAVASKTPARVIPPIIITRDGKDPEAGDEPDVKPATKAVTVVSPAAPTSNRAPESVLPGSAQGVQTPSKTADSVPPRVEPSPVRAASREEKVAASSSNASNAATVTPLAQSTSSSPPVPVATTAVPSTSSAALHPSPEKPSITVPATPPAASVPVSAPVPQSAGEAARAVDRPAVAGPVTSLSGTQATFTLQQITQSIQQVASSRPTPETGEAEKTKAPTGKTLETSGSAPMVGGHPVVPFAVTAHARDVASMPVSGPAGAGAGRSLITLLAAVGLLAVGAGAMWLHVRKASTSGGSSISRAMPRSPNPGTPGGDRSREGR